MSPERSRESLQRSTSYGMRVGCFGISANPPHLGHLETARVIRDSGFVDEVWIIPVFQHPFEKIGGKFNKEELAPWESRLQMLKCLKEPGIRISCVEHERGKISYTIETLAYLRRKYPQHTFYWCIGSGTVINREYEQWHRWEELEKEERFLVVGRPGYPIDANAQKKCFVVIGETAGDPISSTDVRRRVREGRDITRYVGKKIACYISEHKLYETRLH